jgi:alpha-L-fucosidase
MGYYYSLYEWYNPLYKDDTGQYVDAYMLPQLKELITTYEPDLLWTDGEWDHPSGKWRSEEFLAWLFTHSPVKDRVAVNDRWGKETRSKHGGFYTSEYGQAADGKSITEEAARHKWEETRGIGRSFGYNRVEDINDYLSGEQLVHMLVEIVSKGGNLLLNIGPTADGLIPVIMQQRLLEIGDWLGVNGEAIYGTSPWQHQGGFTGVSQPGKTPTVYYTAKKNNLFAICTQWPDKELVVEGLQSKITSVSLIGSSEILKWKMENGQLLIQPPLVSPSRLTSKYAYVFRIELDR